MPYGPDKPRLARAIQVAEVNPWLQQFGQSEDDAAWDGSTACTHVICQFLELLWHGKRLTINQVNSIAGLPYRAKAPSGRPRGMNNIEFQRFCDKRDLPYEVRFGLPYNTVLTYSNRAPIFYGDRYGSEPRWKGYTYHGAKAKPPFAYRNGATQLTGTLVNGRHAVCLLGYRSLVDINGKVYSYRQWRKDPNHGSSSRPERPPYDIIKTTEGKVEYNDYALIAPRSYCALPTRNLPL